MTISDFELLVGGRRMSVHDVGDPAGHPVVYFHGTPTSRLDLDLADETATAENVRVVSFDRPGYGHSDPSSFSLSSIARDALEIADMLELRIFSTLGLSGGGPFALAAGAVGGSRVRSVGIADGVAPYQLAGGIEELSSQDRLACSLLRDDPTGAAEAFGRGFEKLQEVLLNGDSRDVVETFRNALTSRDFALMEDPVVGAALIGSMRESLVQGVDGAAWDNVSYVGPWDFDLSEVRCPVLLWYGEDDRFVPPSHPVWLEANLHDSHLVVKPGEGHFGLFDHYREILQILSG